MRFRYSPLIYIFVVLREWVFSSVGSERYVDNVEVIGSNPIRPTSKLDIRQAFFI